MSDCSPSLQEKRETTELASQLDWGEELARGEDPLGTLRSTPNSFGSSSDHNLLCPLREVLACWEATESLSEKVHALILIPFLS